MEEINTQLTNLAAIDRRQANIQLHGLRTRDSQSEGDRAWPNAILSNNTVNERLQRFDVLGRKDKAGDDERTRRSTGDDFHIRGGENFRNLAADVADIWIDL